MWLIPKDKSSPGDIAYCLSKRIEASRFTAQVDCDRLRNKDGVKVSVVRLRNYKHYCGQHPGQCITGFVQKKHPRNKYLEGLDWVGFNHLINDLLDDLKATYDVFSFNRESLAPKYFIRRGTRRRVKYPYDVQFTWGRATAFWTQGDDDCFESFVGKPNPTIDETEWPDGPGIPCYTLEEEKRLLALPEYDEQLGV